MMRNTQLMKVKEQRAEKAMKERARKKRQIPRKTQISPNMKTTRNPGEKSLPRNTTITTSTRMDLKSISKN